MLRLAKAFWDIALSRRSPAHLPASLFLLGLVAAAVALLEVVGALLPPGPSDRILTRVVLSVGLPLAFAWAVLAITRHRQRFLQTGIALLGVAVLAELVLYPLESLFTVIGVDKPAAIPVGFLMLVGFVWYLLACANIWRAALDSGIAVGIVISIGYLLLSFALERAVAAERLNQMHVHILGIAGTFMGGIAAIAKAAGFRVTGSDLNVYPPMSTQLTALGIEYVQGYGAEQLDVRPDIVVVGNALSRGSPVIEAMLDRGLSYTSGPLWLAEHVLNDRHVLAVAGTHGKTTTSSMLAFILHHAGLAPGFLIGGVPSNFDCTARLGETPYFVIEADEYDTAFFDKRAKFVHYRPRTVILNNLEYDHADIYPDVASIRRQFNQLLRTVPGAGRLVVNGADAELAATLKMGCWTPVDTFGDAGENDWSVVDESGDSQRFSVQRQGHEVARVEWSLLGKHNVMNALAAIAAAADVGIEPERAALALREFRGVKRRMEIRGSVGGVTVYDDFAHHPTAIETTLRGLRARVGDARIVAVVEPRSNTMKLGVHRELLAPALALADRSWFLSAPELDWNLPAALEPLGSRVAFADTVESLVKKIVDDSRAGDQVLVMSNGGFGGLHDKLLAALKARYP